jgi:hypothetical protein
MFYYSYDGQSNVTSKSATAPESGDYGMIDIDFDLDLNDLIIGAVDSDKNITFHTLRPKPTQVLIANINAVKADNNIIGESVAELALQNMQRDGVLDTLGTALAQAQLEIMTLKGDAV